MTANTPSTVINIGNHKNIQIVGKTSTSTAKIGLSYEAIGGGAGYYTDGTYANTSLTFSLNISLLTNVIIAILVKYVSKPAIIIDIQVIFLILILMHQQTEQ